MSAGEAGYGLAVVLGGAASAGFARVEGACEAVAGLGECSVRAAAARARWMWGVRPPRARPRAERFEPGALDPVTRAPPLYIALILQPRVLDPVTRAPPLGERAVVPPNPSQRVRHQVCLHGGRPRLHSLHANTHGWAAPVGRRSRTVPAKPDARSRMSAEAEAHPVLEAVSDPRDGKPAKQKIPHPRGSPAPSPQGAASASEDGAATMENQAPASCSTVSIRSAPYNAGTAPGAVGESGSLARTGCQGALAFGDPPLRSG